ncbi:MAG: TonB-dependent receptor [Inhella sp.]
MTRLFLRAPLGALPLIALLARTGAWADTAALQPVIVTGNPLRSEQFAAPASSLSGTELALRRGGSLGETLEGLPGLASTWFGPNANRPVIRGQDGDRIRVLSNAGASLDASSLSFDHAVPIDPLVVERIEVLRGPAALLYGGSAVGGVVNAIDNRIPRAPLAGTAGVAEARWGGAAAERGLSALLETGSSGLALHADAFWRRTDDLRVPAFEPPAEDGGSERPERRTRVRNSDSSAHGGALGGSLLWNHGFLGASLNSYRNDYGIVAEEDVRIRMQRDQLALAGEVRALSGFFNTLRAQASLSDYRHEEVEGSGAVGTTFKNRGGDLRLEAVHARLPLGAGQLEGVLGFQAERARFEALGEEAFVPSTRSRSAAVFLHEQWQLGAPLMLNAGLRVERAAQDSAGDADPAEPRFGPALQRRFSPRSASVGAVWNLDAQWQLSSSATYTERAPTSYELFAKGVHAATASYEQGDPEQAKERGRNLDLALQWKQGHGLFKLGAFWSRFANYIALVHAGLPEHVDDAGDSLPVYVFQGLPAPRLYGWNWKAAGACPGGPARPGPRSPAGHGARRQLAAASAVRLAPLRATLALHWQLQDLSLKAELQHATRQSRVPGDDRPTLAWTQLHLAASYALRLAGADGLAFIKLNNLGNQLAYNASTVGTLRPLTPLPGRAVMAGLRLSF